MFQKYLDAYESMWKFVEGMGVGEFVCKLLEFHETRASRWRHTEVYRNS